MKKLLLIDASNLLFRSYYATAYRGNLMQNKDGVYTNGIFGFAHAMTKLTKSEYTHILVALDPIGKTFRHEEFKDYKGTRKETPQELKMQFPLMVEYLDALGVYSYQKERYEADDIIGYAAKHFKDKFDEITIFSNDQDLMQLLDTNIKQMVSRKGLKEVEMFTPEHLQDKLGITPNQITDYKGLVGDVSDNIPGVPGIGPKTATKLLLEYNTLENIIANVDKLKGKLKERIQTNQQQAIFSKKLATIETDFANDIDFSKLEYIGYNQEKLINFYSKLSLNSFIKNLKIKKVEKETNYIVIKSINEIKVIIENQGFIHLEIFGKNYHTATPLGFACIFSEIAYFIPFEIALSSQEFIAFLENENKRKSVFDLKQISVALKLKNIDILGIDYDLLLSAYLTNSSVNQDEFREVVELYGYYDVEFEENIYGKGAKFHLPEEKIYIEHAISKVKAIKETKTVALDLIKKYNQESLLNEIEIPLAKVLSDMELIGIYINPQTLEDFGQDLKIKIQETEQMIFAISGKEFNISSPKQLGIILFEDLRLPVYKKTKTGYSTDISVLHKLKKFSPIIELVISYRTYTKLFSTYYEGLKSSIGLLADKRIHTIYQQALTKTGRLSSKEPNLQNIPIKNEEGRLLRKVFEASKDHLLLSFDYSQVELRVLAELGNVKNLKKAFENNRDIHEETAKLIFQKENISKNERSIAKAINFSIIYGKTPWGLSEDLHISFAQAKQFINNYYANYEEIKTFTDKNIEFAKENGYVLTYFKRIIHINEIKSNNYQTREFGKRIAMNAPIQGTAADILKIAMVKIQKVFKEEKIQSKMILQIHDEIVLEVLEEEKEKVIKIVKNTMENAVDFSVKLVVNYSSGHNLYEVK